MSRLVFVLAFAVTALGTGCDIDDSVPPPAPPTGPGPSPQPRPGPVDAGDTDSPFPDGGAATIDAADLSCGDFGGTCCTEGPACAGDFLHCDPQLGVCNVCGDIADDCCSEGPACQPGLTCNAGVCGP
jgi:hypothetical protein